MKLESLKFPEVKVICCIEFMDYFTLWQHYICFNAIGVAMLNQMLISSGWRAKDNSATGSVINSGTNSDNSNFQLGKEIYFFLLFSIII